MSVIYSQAPARTMALHRSVDRAVRIAAGALAAKVHARSSLGSSVRTMVLGR